jgi:hypothetical protein
MATIKAFEDIIAWQKARELCRIVGEHIDNKKFKHNFSLLDQLERSSGSVMDNIAEGFERGGNRGNSCNSYTFQKVLVANLNHRYIEHWIGAILLNWSSMLCVR